MFHTLEYHWPRREHFHHYMDTVRCTYSLTVEVDITELRRALKARGLKAYPAQVYMLASTVNRFPEFRMGVSATGEPGYWEMLHPAYTVFNPATETFASIWTPYKSDFPSFYEFCTDDMAQYGSAAGLMPKAGTPPNVFDISSLPWLDFTAFNLNVFGEGTHLLPVFTIGRYLERDDKTLMPIAMQLHHAACDGYHAGRFVEALRQMAADFEHWL